MAGISVNFSIPSKKAVILSESAVIKPMIYIYACRTG